MKSELSLEELLRWRLAQAEASAPPAPRAARLLELAQPWWEAWPARFRTLAERLERMQVAYGHAMAEPLRGRSGYLVPALVVRATDELETATRVLYLSVREGRLRLRFQVADLPGEVEPAFDVTLVSSRDARPLFSSHAERSVESEYRLDAPLSTELAEAWEPLKVTDRMPFRFILRAGPETA